MTNTWINLRGGRRIRRWVFVLGSLVVALSLVVLISNRGIVLDVVCGAGILVGILVLWRGSSKIKH
jgi:hypothetical protein